MRASGSGAKGMDLSSGNLSLFAAGPVRRENEVDKSFGGAEIVQRIEETIKLRGREDGGKVFFADEGVAQIALFRLSAAAGDTDAAINSLAAEFFAEEHADGFGEDEAVSEVGIAAHPVRINSEGRSDVSEMTQAAGGIDDVLTGRAPVHIASGLQIFPGNAGGEFFYERNRRISSGCRGMGQGRKVHQLGATVGGDCVRSRRGNYAGARFGASERRFEIEHGLNRSLAGINPLNGRRTEQFV